MDLKIHEWVNTVLIGAMFIFMVLVGGHQSVPNSGGPSNFDTLSGSALQVGLGCDSEFTTCTGTAVSQLLTGTGALIYSNSTVTASTTRFFDIAVTGVVAGDKVFVQTATTTANGAGWLITEASASSTPGFITLGVVNNSGVTGNIPRNIASATPYLILR